MATMIGGKCIGCGACEPVCPGDGIRRGDGIFVIDPTRCTECVGFYRRQQCEKVCPLEDTCLPDPDRVETENVLFARAMAITADGDRPPVLTAKTSHFRPAEPSWWKRAISG